MVFFDNTEYIERLRNTGSPRNMLISTLILHSRVFRRLECRGSAHYSDLLKRKPKAGFFPMNEFRHAYMCVECLSNKAPSNSAPFPSQRVKDEDED